MGRKVVHCLQCLGLLVVPVTSPGSAPAGPCPITEVSLSSLARSNTALVELLLSLKCPKSGRENGGGCSVVCAEESPKPCCSLQLRSPPLGMLLLQTKKCREKIMTCFGLCHSPEAQRDPQSPNPRITWNSEGVCWQGFIFKLPCRASGTRRFASNAKSISREAEIVPRCEGHSPLTQAGTPLPDSRARTMHAEPSISSSFLLQKRNSSYLHLMTYLQHPGLQFFTILWTFQQNQGAGCPVSSPHNCWEGRSADGPAGEHAQDTSSPHWPPRAPGWGPEAFL